MSQNERSGAKVNIETDICIVIYYVITEWKPVYAWIKQFYHSHTQNILCVGDTFDIYYYINNPMGNFIEYHFQHIFHNYCQLSFAINAMHVNQHNSIMLSKTRNSVE